jgi:hypothetical protein
MRFQRQHRVVAPIACLLALPLLPAGLNLGRQLYWQQANFPAEFARARHILMYPRYWAWRLSGKLASEVTSLGCHTDLWAPEENAWSSLVERQGWTALFPPLQSPLAATRGTIAGTCRDDQPAWSLRRTHGRSRQQRQPIAIPESPSGEPLLSCFERHLGGLHVDGKPFRRPGRVA